TSHLHALPPRRSSDLTALTSAPSPSVFGQATTLTATVTAPGSGTPTGTVAFFDGATLLGTGTLTGGTATFTTTALSTGAHTLTASFHRHTELHAPTPA